jgi:flagellar protein FlaG
MAARRLIVNGMLVMEIGGTAKPTQIEALNASQRTDAAIPAGAVKTDLAPGATVQQIREAQAVRFDPTDGVQARATLDEVLRDFIKRKVTIDPKTREVVYQSIDQRTGEVVRQVPDEALMRLRAYARALREQSRDQGQSTDVKSA